MFVPTAEPLTLLSYPPWSPGVNLLVPSQFRHEKQKNHHLCLQLDFCLSLIVPWRCLFNEAGQKQLSWAGKALGTKQDEARGQPYCPLLSLLLWDASLPNGYIISGMPTKRQKKKKVNFLKSEKNKQINRSLIVWQLHNLRLWSERVCFWS